MKTMSVYGLLGKIYNYNDDLPKRILFRDRIYELDDYNHYVYEETNSSVISYIDLFDETLNWELDDFLHEQVGIIENDETGKKGIPEKLDLAWQNAFDEQVQQDCIKMILENINTILDYLKSKGE